MMHNPVRLVGYTLLWLELLLFLIVPGITWAAIMATLESPENGQAVSGIAIIRGWAFDTQAGVKISSVELFIDGARSGNIPCCSERGDVQAAFPQFPSENTLNSGFGLTFNWGLLSSGSHTVRVEMRTTAGGFFSTETRTVTVVRPGDFEFLSQFDLTNATVSLSGSSIVVNGVQVTDQITGQTKTINATFGWSQSSQALIMTSATTVGEEDGCVFQTTKWISYAPTGFDPIASVYPPASQILEDLKALKSSGFEGLITFGSEQTLSLIPSQARAAGFQCVIMGIFLNPTDDALNQAEIANAVAVAPFVDAYGVGHEFLRRGGSRAALEDYLQSVSAQTGKPVATSEPVDSYFSDPSLLDLGDFVFPVTHPFFADLTDPCAAASWTIDKYTGLKNMLSARGLSGKGMLIKETGLPSSGCQGCSETNQRDYFRHLRTSQTQGKVFFSHFEAFDQPWKSQTEGAWGPFWGLFRADRSAKLAGSDLFTESACP